VFRAPLSALQPIKCFPHPVAALANNHSMDYGPAGLIGTIEALDTWGISRAGGGKTEAEASAETRVEPGSVSILSFGFDNDSSSYCDLNGSCIAPLNIVLMKQKIAGCEATSAATVVMLHWGVEYDTRFNGCQQTLAHSLVRAGADLVIGTGPHVLQGIEVYQGSLICYSLGNLVFDDLGNDESSASIIVRLTLAGSGDRLAEAFEIAPLRTADILAGPERPSPDDARGIVQNIAKRSPDTGILTLRPTGDDHGLLWFRINR